MTVYVHITHKFFVILTEVIIARKGCLILLHDSDYSIYISNLLIISLLIKQLLTSEKKYISENKFQLFLK